ncbi:MAG: haloacid dehalogenase-like hydrolase [Gemmatimonadetes bacterium]|nr:haloacid dehalogenase-like hydrolase [Gemmatimonadota bacterium]
MRVVLFDIDGTLLRSGVGKRAMERAMLATAGTVGEPGHRYDGKTDRQIVREALTWGGLDDAAIDAHLPLIEARYVEALHDELGKAHGMRLLPGVEALLDAVEARADMMMGLLTGNIAAGARAKLAAVGIDAGRFRVGAFGSDHELRHELPAIAQARAREMLAREVRGEAMVIVGDTPSDISCGRGVGARAVAVATGHFSVGELAAHGPAAVFADFTDTAAVVTALATV